MRAKDILGVWEKSTISEISQAPIDKIAPFKIRFDPVGRTNHVISKKLGSKFIAYFDPAPVKLQVGTRIIAVYMDPEDRNGREDFYSGIIAEPPKAMNRYRYLGTISLKMLMVTIFINFVTNIDIVHEKISTTINIKIFVWKTTRPGI